MKMFARWLTLTENRSAYLAARQVARLLLHTPTIGRQPSRSHCNPLFLHGAPGTGKSHLASALTDTVVARNPRFIAVTLIAHDLTPASVDLGDVQDAEVRATRGADLVIVEDLQHLPVSAAERLIDLLDRGLARGQQWIVTASEGPGRLTHLPARLLSHLAAGLVVGLSPLGPASRRNVLVELFDRHGRTLEPASLDWLASHTSGSWRDLDGCVRRIDTLSQLHGRMLTLAQIQAEFQPEVVAQRLGVDRIVQRVSRYFRVDLDELQGKGRTPGVVLPRQVSMYLARRLTDLSLDQIGAYFGGRDHTTVLHACRKVETALEHDIHLSGAVRQLRADLL